MREIQFRGKRMDNGEWIEGHLLTVTLLEETAYLIFADSFQIICGEVKASLHALVDLDTVGQYTGLKDKNGKKIFEGDVVKFTDSPFGYSYAGVVCFNEGSFCIKYEYWKKEKFHRIGQTDKWQDMGASGIVTYQYEILGNIHDNPELIGGGEDV